MSDPGSDIPARDHVERSLAVRCEDCRTWCETELGPRTDSPPRELPEQVSCRNCDATIPVSLRAHVDQQGQLDGCPACEYHTLCIQKDVNPRLGVILIAVTYAALLFSGLSIPQTIAALIAVTLLDWLILRALVRRLLICYRCKAQYRGFPPGARCRPFDLATWEAHTPPAEDG